MHPNTVTPELIHFIKHEELRGVSATSQYKYLSALRTFFKFIKARGYIESNPVQTYMLPGNAHNARTRTLDTHSADGITSEYRAFLDALHDWDNLHADLLRPYYLTMLYTCARPKEVLQLKWCDVDLENHCIKLQSANTKNSKARLAGINSALQQILMDWKLRNQSKTYVFESPKKPGKPIASLQYKINQFKKANPAFADIARNDMRRTGATLLMANNVQIEKIAKILGHSSPVVTLKHYAHTDANQINQTLECLA